MQIMPLFSNKQLRSRLVALVQNKCIFILLAFAAYHSYGQMKARIVPSAKQTIETLYPSINVKLVFICQDTMRYVDFSDPAPQIRKMTGVISAYFPVISANGRWVTYQTGIEAEGPSTKGKVGTIWVREFGADGTPVKVADTGFVPRFVEKPSSDAPEIVYSTSVECPDNICYSSGKTLRKKIINKIPQSAEIVYSGGSYYGGLSRDERYLITGWPAGPNAFMLDLQDASGVPHQVHTMRVKKNSTGVDTFVTIGTCNVSRSASTIFTNTMLYYDFSSAAIKNADCHHPIIGSWGMHSKLFLSRYDGEDMKVFDVPADRPLVSATDAQGQGEAVGKEWYCPEWSNHPYYAVSSLLVDRLFNVNSHWEHTANGESIYLVNLKDSLYVKIIESTDTAFTSKISLNNPYVWVEVPGGFSEDTTWLRHTIWERALQHVRHTVKPNLYGGENTFLKGRDITALDVYSLSGRKIATINGFEKTRCNPANALKNVRCGVYLIGVEARNAQKMFFRWIVE